MRVVHWPRNDINVDDIIHYSLSTLPLSLCLKCHARRRGMRALLLSPLLSEKKYG